MLAAKVIILFVLFGFLAGIAAYYLGGPLSTVILEMLPQLVVMPWFLSGLAGALLTVALVITWNWMMQNR
jgi:hypothetical protein